MYHITKKTLFSNNKCICSVYADYIIVYDGCGYGYWRLRYYDVRKKPAKLKTRRFEFKELSIINGDIAYRDEYLPDERLDKVRQMLTSGIIDTDLCDYVRSIFEKIDAKHDIIVNDLYIYQDRVAKDVFMLNNSVQLRGNTLLILDYEYKLEDSFALSISNGSISIDTAYRSIILQIFYTLITNNANMKSARK